MTVKIKTLTNGAFAPNCRDMLYFGTDEIHETSTRLTDENLHRMVELKLAEYHESDDEKEIENVDETLPETSGEENSETVEVEKPEIEPSGDFTDITDKNELYEHAKEIYQVDLDKRKSIENMKKDLEEFISNPA